MITFVGGFFISIWLANYLGPAQFGVYAYALAIYSIAGSFSKLGLTGIAVKELVETKDNNTSITTIFVLKSIGASIGYIGLIIFLFFFCDSDSKFWMTIIIGLGVFCSPFTVLDNYFDSQVLSKYKVISRKSAYIVKSLLVIIFIVFQLDIQYLAWIVLSEFILSSFILAHLYMRLGNRHRVRFSISKARKLLLESWPLIISGLGAMLYLKMDQVMVTSMIDDKSGGHYAAAVRYTSIFYFLHGIIITTFFPSLIKIKNKSEKDYLHSIMKLSCYLLYIALAVILGTYLFITPFIKLTFGVEYFSSISIIKLHIWSLPLVFLGAVLSKWLIIESLTKFSILRHVLGLVVNLILNLILIPKYGPEGAAFASIMALLFSVIAVLIFHPRLQLLGKVFAKALVFPIMIRPKSV